MKIFQAKTNDYIRHDKNIGLNLTNEKIPEAFSSFFDNGIENRRKEFLPLFVHKLREILSWFQGQSLFRFYSSSLLFIYEGDPNLEPRVELKFIDFAHVFDIEDGGRDERVLFGLTTLLTYLEELEVLHVESLDKNK